MNLTKIILLFSISCIMINIEMFSQNTSYCSLTTVYDSLYYEKTDTFHYKITYFSKKDKEVKGWAIVYKKDSIQLVDGPYAYYKNGKLLEEGTYKMGKHCGNIIWYYSNGNIRRISLILTDTTGYEREFYENGIVKVTGNTTHGKETGDWIYYYDSGFIEKRGTYRQIHISKENIIELSNINGILAGNYLSVKDGEWLYFDTNGMLVLEEIYDNGILIKAKQQQ